MCRKGRGRDVPDNYVPEGVPCGWLSGSPWQRQDDSGLSVWKYHMWVRLQIIEEVWCLLHSLHPWESSRNTEKCKNPPHMRFLSIGNVKKRQIEVISLNRKYRIVTKSQVKFYAFTSLGFFIFIWIFTQSEMQVVSSSSFPFQQWAVPWLG